MLIYDCEIIKGPPPKNPEDRVEGIEYCDGWRDFENMGISVIGAYDTIDRRIRVFCEDNFDVFQGLVRQHDVIVSFNGVQFDDKLCAAHGIEVDSTYDILREMWRAAGLPATYKGDAQKGFGLDETAKANQMGGKTGHGAQAPVLWQNGLYGQVIDYCIQDVRLTAALMIEGIMRRGCLTDPRSTEKMLPMPSPWMRTEPYVQETA